MLQTGQTAMEHATSLHFAGAVFEISLIDLMLSADNALVIAMCCAALPAAHVRTAVALGTVGAIVLRGLLTTIAGFILRISWLKVIAAIALAAIAIKLIVAHARNDVAGEEALQPADTGTQAQRVAGSARTAAWNAIATFVAADALMSLDNIVALGAIARGSTLLLIFGLVLSIPLLVFGGLLVVGLLQRHPGVVEAGGILLGWIAGEIALTDPAIASWAEREAPALAVALPLLVAILVFWESRIIISARRHGISFTCTTGPNGAAAQRDLHSVSLQTQRTATQRTE
jgi:YjbE family integral membrane protein